MRVRLWIPQELLISMASNNLLMRLSSVHSHEAPWRCRAVTHELFSTEKCMDGLTRLSCHCGKVILSESWHEPMSPCDHAESRKRGLDLLPSPGMGSTLGVAACDAA